MSTGLLQDVINGPNKNVAAAQGAVGAAVNVAGSDILPQAGNLNTEGQNLFNTSQDTLSQYAQQIENALSTDPSTRMESIAPIVAQDTALAQGEKTAIANQPRSGATAYENAQVDQSTETQIGNALSAAFNQATTQLGQLGMFEQTAGTGLQEAGIKAEEGAAGIDVNAAGGYDSLAGITSANNQATDQELAQIAELIAAA